ncbi:asparagine synthase (glutamine-hydrolyzing) [soil metagenome]
MCGINLIIDKKGILDFIPIKKMNLASHHRGPDFQHFLEIKKSDFNIFLGHNRLKIIDPGDRANQPMVSSCGRYYLSYNGEIYNFYEIKNRLIDQGVKFTTHSDTEVLLNLLVKKGESALTDLQGMFAFVFYDQERDKFLLARDRHGMKPLYYFDNENFFIVSSETRAILASGLIKKELNEEQVYFYLQYKFAKAPETFYKGITALLPGNVMEYQNHHASVKSYFISTRLPNENSDDLEEILVKTEDLLIDSISRHLISDVPAALFLSGGVDSTLLLALIIKAGLPQIPSFSIVNHPKEKSFGTQDYKYAKKAADHYGSFHYEYQLDAEILERFEEFIQNMDQPIGDSAGLLTYVLSEKASQKAGIVLSGAGADEVFAGYNRHLAFYRYLKYHSSIVKFLPTLQGASRILPTGFEHPFRKKFQLLKKFFLNLNKDTATTYNNFLSFPDFKRFNATLWSSNGNQKTQNEDILRKALQHDRENYLVSDVLSINDLMSMQHSLEIRMPYLDDPLTSYIDALPGKTLLAGGRKWILNSILAKNGGSEFVKRPKEGFGLPFGRWLKIPESSTLRKQLSDNQNILFKYIDKDQVRGILKSHTKNEKDCTLELWSLIVLSAWLNKEFRV